MTESKPGNAARGVVNSLLAILWTSLMVPGGWLGGVLFSDRDFFWRRQRDWARGLLALCGIRVEVLGLANAKKGGGYVLMANHESLLDIAVLMAVLPEMPSFFAKSELSRVPILGSALRLGHHVVVDRGKSNAIEGIRSATSVLSRGRSICVFPEGTRSEPGTLGRFKKGGFYIARHAGRPVLPIGIDGSGRLLSRGSFVTRSGPVRVLLGEPIESDLEEAELCGRVREAISSCLDRCPTEKVFV